MTIDNSKQNIAIVTDSTADIPKELIKENDITVVPMYIIVGDQAYKEGVNITTNEVLTALKEGKTIKTSAPSVGDFIEVFRYLIEEKKKDIIYFLGLSSHLSGTINAAIIASKSFHDVKIKIIDTKNVTISMGLIAIEAARAVLRGKQEQEIDSLLNILIKRNKFFATIDNFSYLFKGGRAPFLGKFLNMVAIFKPILTLTSNGKVSLKKMTRNRKKAFTGIYNLIRNEAKQNERCRIGIFYGEDIKPALELRDIITQDKSIKIDEMIITEITTIMSAHTGPDIWGVGYSPVIEDSMLLPN